MKKILKYNCYLSSFLMLIYSVFLYFNVGTTFYHKTFIFLLFFYLLVILIVFSLALLNQKKKVQKSVKKGVTIGRKDVMNFISLIVYLFVNRDLLDNTVESSVHTVLGLVIYFIIAILIDIADEWEFIQNKE